MGETKAGSCEMTSYSHGVGQEQDWKGNLHLLGPKGPQMPKLRLRMAFRKSVSWSEAKGLTCHRLSLPHPIIKQQKADDRRVTQSFPSLLAATGAEVPSHQPAKPIAQLRWPLLWSSGAGWSRWRQESSNSKQGGSFHFKGKIVQRELHGPIPSRRCISQSCFPW